jgi:hypothetical protein
MMLRKILTTLFCLVGTHAFAYMPAGDIDVRMQDGAVCFALPDEEFGFFSRENVYRGYDVSVDSGERYHEIWGYYLNQGVVLKKKDCLVYGVLPENAVTDYDRGAGGEAVAPPLKFNTIYSVRFMGMGRYDMAFCLIKSATGEITVRQEKKTKDLGEDCRTDPNYPDQTKKTTYPINKPEQENKQKQ